MRNYEVTFIVDPVLSGDEIKSTAKTYEDLIKNEGGKIVHLDEMGLRQLAYPINKRSSGVYFTIEFQIDSDTIIAMLELSMQRDERIMRFLTIRLDKYGVKYNDDKRNGLIGKRKSAQDKGKKNPKDSGAKTATAVKEKAAPAPKAEEAPAPKAVETPTPKEKETPAPVAVAEVTKDEEE
jgi:small subunit ribosomal protein S6